MGLVWLSNDVGQALHRVPPSAKLGELLAQASPAAPSEPFGSTAKNPLLQRVLLMSDGDFKPATSC
jgi:hypothetical protein